MGKHIQWREPPDRDDRAQSGMMAFGGRTDRGHGYMSQSSRVGPGVLVLHEFFGLQESFKSYADDLNREGFTVLAVDLYDGAIAGSVEEARSLATELDAEKTIARLRAACRHLTDNWHPRLGAIGFSLGAELAGMLAREELLDATVLYYGAPEEITGWVGPVMGHFAERDEWIPLSEASVSFERLSEQGVETELYVYPSVGHWFANASVAGAHDEAAASQAFRRTVDFLHRNLA